MGGLAENIATQPSLAGAWGDLKKGEYPESYGSSLFHRSRDTRIMSKPCYFKLNKIILS